MSVLAFAGGPFSDSQDLSTLQRLFWSLLPRGLHEHPKLKLTVIYLLLLTSLPLYKSSWVFILLKPHFRGLSVVCRLTAKVPQESMGKQPSSVIHKPPNVLPSWRVEGVQDSMVTLGRTNSDFLLLFQLRNAMVNRKTGKFSMEVKKTVDKGVHFSQTFLPLNLKQTTVKN